MFIIIRINLQYAILHGALMFFADFSDANFQCAVLDGANFSNSNLTSANLSNTSLVQSDFSGADLKGANFNGAIITGAKFAGAKNCNLSGARGQPESLPL